MDKDSVNLIKIVGFYDLIISIIVSLFLYLLLGIRDYFFGLGILCSFINFIINAYTTEKLIVKHSNFKVLGILLSYIVRIGLVCGTGLAIVTKSKIGFAIFIAGYSAQLIAIVLYGLKLKKMEGV